MTMLTVKCSFLPHRKWNTIKLNAGGTNGIGPVCRAAGVEIILQKRNNADICNPANSVASEVYHDWSGEDADVQLRVNFTLKLLLSQNFCNRPLMRFISFASNIGPAAAVPVGPAPAPL